MSQFAVNEENPYASPQVVSSPGGRAGIPEAIWSHGDLVIAHRNALWPKTCIVTGRGGDVQLNFSLATQYPGWILPIFIVVLVASTGLAVNVIPPPFGGIFAGVAIVLCFVGLFSALAYLAMPRQLNFYLSNDAYESRKKQLQRGWILVSSGIPFIVASIAIGVQIHVFIAIAGFTVGLMVTAVGGNYLSRWRRILHPTKMHREYTVFTGAGKSFLMQLPPWPYGPP